VIFAVTGTPGSGKSFYAVRKIADSVTRGKLVATNVPLEAGWSLEIAKRHTPLAFLRRGRVKKRARLYESRVYLLQDMSELVNIRLRGTGEGRGIAVLDEAHEWVNSRMWKDEGRATMVAWFSKHRHYGWDVYLITQYLDSIDKQIRDRVEWHVVLRNLKAVKLMGIRLFWFNLFLAIHVWAGGPTAARHVGKREAFLLDSRRKLYATHGLAFEDAGEATIWLPQRIPAGDIAGGRLPKGEALPAASVEAPGKTGH